MGEQDGQKIVVFSPTIGDYEHLIEKIFSPMHARGHAARL